VNLSEPRMTESFVVTSPADDPLGILATTAPVMENNAQVRLDAEAARAFAAACRRTSPPVAEEDALHATFLPPRRFCTYLLALEAMNFCFWDEAPRWSVDYRGHRHDGYWALAAALHRALREDALPLWDAHYLAELDEAALAHLLRGEGRPVPLLAERTANVREAGRVLLERWGGEFANVVEAAYGDAVTLVRLIVREFPSFRDETRWHGHVVKFFKRAQITVADLTRMLPDPPGGPLTGLERLTAFADYKVPQVLRKEGILVPDEALAARLERGEELPAGSDEEIAIRAATVWGVEWVVRAWRRLLPEGESAPSAADVDLRLWLAGQDKSGLPPYHRTRTIYY